jgi:3-mercaptopyruvate sulfurtransferase SseA
MVRKKNSFHRIGPACIFSIRITFRFVSFLFRQMYGIFPLKGNNKMLKLSRKVFLFSFAFLLTCGVIPDIALGAPAKSTQSSQLPIIVSVSQAKELASSGAKIVDLRSADDYAKGHIPGAIGLPWRKFNTREIDGIRNEFVSDDVIQKELAAAGLTYDDTLLIYETSALPGRAFVVFDYAGFDKLHVLDGGIDAWKDKLSTDATTLAPSAFRLDRKKEIRVDKAFVASKVGKQGVTIVDARDEEAYQDGHIPGAQSLPVQSLLQSDKTLKSKSVLTNLLASKGIGDPNAEIVLYCGSGVYAANTYLALRNSGYKKLAFYDASWDEWSRDPKAGQSVSLDNYSFDFAAPPTAQTADGVPLVGKSEHPQFLSSDQLLKTVDSGKTVILDVRSPADYDWGHIPNSVNVFWDSTLNPDRTLKSAAELGKIYKQAGVTPDKRIIIYARGGFQLTHTYTVLSLLGYKEIDFFTGKFEGWKSK